MTTVQPVPPVEEEATAVAMGVAVLGAITRAKVGFGWPLTEDFLRTTMISK
jgi:hypothetical protein